MQTILYVRVSTAEQTAAHQRTQAEKAGFRIDHVVEDEGVSGITIRLQDRPQGRRLFDMLRRGDTLVVRWVDRLGRNYADVTETIREFMKRGVVIRTVIDRKSTRLNSSHVVISYAVFCLKKKKTTAAS